MDATEKHGRLSSRLKIAMNGMTPGVLAQNSGVSEGTIRNILNETMPRVDNLEKICDALGYSLVWMIKGWGPEKQDELVACRRTVVAHSLSTKITAQVKTSQDISEYIDRTISDLFESSDVIDEGYGEYSIDFHEPIIDELKDYVAALAFKYPVAPDIGAQFELVKRYEVEASAGGGSLIERESEIGKLAFRRDWINQKGLSAKDLMVIRITGDSMEPTIKDGALALVDGNQEQLKADGIYVLQMDGHLIAKRVQQDLSGGVYIKSDNKAYDTIQLAHQELENLFVIGRVVWAGQEV